MARGDNIIVPRNVRESRARRAAEQRIADEQSARANAAKDAAGTRPISNVEAQSGANLTEAQQRAATGSVDAVAGTVPPKTGATKTTRTADTTVSKE